MIRRLTPRSRVLVALAFATGALLLVGLTWPQHAPLPGTALDIDACVGGEQGYLAVTVTTEGAAYFFLSTVFKNSMEENLICWIPGDRRVIVDPPAIKVIHAPW